LKTVPSPFPIGTTSFSTFFFSFSILFHPEISVDLPPPLFSLLLSSGSGKILILLPLTDRFRISPQAPLSVFTVPILHPQLVDEISLFETNSLFPAPLPSPCSFPIFRLPCLIVLLTLEVEETIHSPPRPFIKVFLNLFFLFPPPDKSFFHHNSSEESSPFVLLPRRLSVRVRAPFFAAGFSPLSPFPLKGKL